MTETTHYTKGLFTAVPHAHPHPIVGGQYQGMVSLRRDDGLRKEDSLYTVDEPSATQELALQEAQALAHRILAELEI